MSAESRDRQSWVAFSTAQGLEPHPPSGLYHPPRGAPTGLEIWRQGSGDTVTGCFPPAKFRDQGEVRKLDGIPLCAI